MTVLGPHRAAVGLADDVDDRVLQHPGETFELLQPGCEVAAVERVEVAGQPADRLPQLRLRTHVPQYD